MEMPNWLSTTLSVLYYIILLPVVKLVQLILLVLLPLLSLVQWILLPVTHLARVLLGVALLPFHAQLLSRFETIYIYLGVAGVIGSITGLILFACFNFLSALLRIDAAPEDTQAKGMTAASYRAARRRKQAIQPIYPLSPTVLKEEVTGPHRNLLAQTIVEEEDSDL
ncbi:uncharacterized protein BDZ99DRAFT_440359 [Mytilinidion resinicola]|uniref:Uncharacterized protein n=1 Tax=Mytilinidion resinicola TaxID=574789 RepID=A0A6A6YRD0_9PEZI|nr:uncharacterized protein BDZ99DRAFT_440359 [Mytilinidion resinicola]KAF2811486.1 hypothetical protein BDZ99DRAFT_440359 [Mytilinidion resinicola]